MCAQKKAALRAKMKLKMKKQAYLERRQNSIIVQKKVLSEKDFLKANCVMLYVSKGTREVQTDILINKALKMGKKVVLPVTLNRERNIEPVYLKDFRGGLIKGLYGIYEPVMSYNEKPAKLEDIDLVIVPGLAFDRNNNRLGHGHGYYDNFLRHLPGHISTIGLGFRFQLFKNIPVTSHDVSLAKVITN
jgi:5-formyltetrahydrofolate cyclo-ligase